MKKRTIFLCIELAMAIIVMAQRVNIVTAKGASAREQYAAEYLQKKLTALGYETTPKKGVRITLTNAKSGTEEGYTITKNKKGIVVSGNDAKGS